MRVCLAAGACSTCLALLPAVPAAAAKLHRVATDTTSYASDGTRYVAWEVHAHHGISVLDTGTRRRIEVSSRCGLEDGAPAAADRFLLGCAAEEQALLDVQTGVVIPLPKPPPHLIGEYGPIWTGVGLRYVIGKAGLHARCQRPKRHESCTALYDIATGVMSEVPESGVPDPDRRGAPPLCRALRRKVFRRSKLETLEGMGPLGPLQSGFSYRNGLFAKPEQIGEAPVRNVRIVRCHGAPTVLSIRREPPNPEPFPSDLQLGGGFLTWDTGHPSAAFDEEVMEGPRAGLRRGTLTSYDLRTRRLRSWRLPAMRLELHGLDPREWPVGVFGYSAHTHYAAFWIAAQDVNCGNEIVREDSGSCEATATSSIYESPSLVHMNACRA